MYVSNFAKEILSLNFLLFSSFLNSAYLIWGKSVWDTSQLAVLLLTLRHILHPRLLPASGINAPMLKEFKSLSILLTVLHQRWGL